MIRRIFTGLIVMSLAGAAFADTTVSFTDKNIRTSVGQSFNVDIVLSDFPPTRGGGIIIQFDPSVIDLSDVAVDANTWSFTKVFGLEESANGSVEIWFASWDLLSGDARIATLTFESVSAGNSQLGMQASDRNPFINGDNMPLQVSYKKSVVQVRR